MPNFGQTGAPCIIKIQRFPLSMSILGQKACILGPTIFKIPQPNWYYYIYSRDSFTCSILCLKDDSCQHFSVYNKTGIWECLSVSDDCLKEQPGDLNGTIIQKCRVDFHNNYPSLLYFCTQISLVSAPWVMKTMKWFRTNVTISKKWQWIMKQHKIIVKESLDYLQAIW